MNESAFIPQNCPDILVSEARFTVLDSAADYMGGSFNELK